jgi:hypothetical protein
MSGAVGELQKTVIPATFKTGTPRGASVRYSAKRVNENIGGQPSQVAPKEIAGPAISRSGNALSASRSTKCTNKLTGGSKAVETIIR